jgi:hypothetical protein
VETGIGDIHTAMLSVLPPAWAAAVCDEVTVDFDTTEVEVYGPGNGGWLFNYQGQRCGCLHEASWAQTTTVLVRI